MIIDKKLIREILCSMRQLFFPCEFRISQVRNELSFEDDIGNIPELQKIIDAIQSLNSKQTVEPKNAGDDEKFMANLATRLWRIRGSMLKPDTEEPFDEIKRGYSHIDRLISLLEQQYGIRIVDKVGGSYDAGMSMKVVSAESVEGITREIIKETIEPAVYKNDRPIQLSQIVVGKPIDEEDSVVTQSE